MESMSILKGAGKVFEIVKKLTDAVLRLGGDEELMLQLLKPKGSETIDGFARVLVGAARIVPIPDTDIASRGEACVQVLRGALERLNSHAHVAMVFWDNVDRRRDIYTAMALRLIESEVDLVAIAVSSRVNHADAEFATKRVIGQESLYDIARIAPHFRARVAAVERLSPERALSVLRDTDQEPLLRSKATAKCTDPEALREALRTVGAGSLLVQAILDQLRALES